MQLRAIHKALYPILVVHGVQDQLAVEAAGRALAHRLGKRAKFVALSGAAMAFQHQIARSVTLCVLVRAQTCMDAYD